MEDFEKALGVDNLRIWGDGECFVFYYDKDGFTYKWKIYRSGMNRSSEIWGAFAEPKLIFKIQEQRCSTTSEK